MIYCNNQVYMKVWKIFEKKEKYMDLSCSTSEKDLDGNYVNSNWTPRLIGHAFNTLKDKLKAGDRILVTKCKFTNERYQDKESGEWKQNFKLLILEADTVDSVSGGSKPAAETAPAANAHGATETEQPAEEESPW